MYLFRSWVDIWLINLQGAPYKYIVAVDSTPFEESPRVVTRSLELLQEKVQLVHSETEFNEILSVGYFEGQKMDVGLLSHMHL